ncbi:alpha/beta fold hydrolase [Agromyces bauzanensis]
MSVVQAGMKRQYADGPFGQIHFQAAVGGEPLVMLHQSVMTSDEFSAVFAHLIERGVRPIAIDMPGFGLSDAPPFVPEIADYAGCVEPVLDALGIAHASLVGHHTGALVATEVAIELPDRIDRVVIHGVLLMDEAGTGLLEEIVTTSRAFHPLPHAAHMLEIAELRERFAEPTIGPDRISDYVVQAMLAWQRGAYWYGHSAVARYRHGDRLPLITQPGLFISNTGYHMHDYIERGRALRPDFAYTELEGGGIDICDHDPAGWAAAIADFIRV